jgi:hypothetical protein
MIQFVVFKFPVINTIFPHINAKIWKNDEAVSLLAGHIFFLSLPAREQVPKRGLALTSRK